ncbi:hypothetical protein [Nonomuraea dietziae]|uniref:Uncharacterized protein n=1 Tax=Nonomuraea dietziae TaxID=65515 RepID=A0A7W5VED6_9ACTN|nr:hypothetical protein [Nonomuraea dietziae]MBB3730084.1 hypothetical protein [Nonomuraea dietziae]
MTPESAIFAVLRSTAVVNRESFTLATFDPDTGRINGHISAHEFAGELVHALDLCQNTRTPCATCQEYDASE